MHALQTRAPALRVDACLAQHRGDRTQQQDRVGIFASEHAPRHALCVLADGVGGRSGSRYAADTVVLLAKRRFARFKPERESAHAFFESLVSELHDRLRADGASACLQPHSTFAALLLAPGQATWCHLGDSRVYRLRPGHPPEHTLDHSYERLLMERDGLSQDQARRDPRASRLVHLLGAAHCPRPSIDQAGELNAGQCFLLCSDGLWSQFEAPEIASLVHTLTPRQAAQTMILAARRRAAGRADNCSLALLRFSD